MDARDFKGMQIAATMPVRRSTHGWIVPSQSGPHSYSVSAAHPALKNITNALSDLECNCPDFELRRLPCKHVIAVELTVKREVTTDEGIMTEEVSVTYTQDWTAYNKAQNVEKDMFLPMLKDLCGTIPQPPQGRGRPRLPMSDMAFDAIYRVYAGLSARRFDSDVRDATAKGLTAQDAHFNSVLGYLRKPEMTDVLKQLVVTSALPLTAVENDFAIDSTGFTTSRFVRWYDEKWGKERSKNEWVKLHAICGVRTNIVTAVEMTSYRGHGSADSQQFAPLVEKTAENFGLRDVMADKAYSSRAAHNLVDDLGGTPFIPFKGAIPAMQGTLAMPIQAGGMWSKMYHLFAWERDTFLTRYHQRSNVECTFSMIKRKFGDSLRSKSDTGQLNEVLCKVVAHNICVLIACIHEIGLEMPQFAGA